VNAADETRLMDELKFQLVRFYYEDAQQNPSLTAGAAWLVAQSGQRMTPRDEMINGAIETAFGYIVFGVVILGGCGSIAMVLSSAEIATRVAWNWLKRHTVGDVPLGRNERRFRKC